MIFILIIDLSNTIIYVVLACLVNNSQVNEKCMTFDVTKKGYPTETIGLPHKTQSEIIIPG